MYALSIFFAVIPKVHESEMRWCIFKINPPVPLLYLKIVKAYNLSLKISIFLATHCCSSSGNLDSS